MKSSLRVAHLLCGKEMGGIATVLFTLIREKKSFSDLIIIALKKTELTEEISRRGAKLKIIPAGFIINPVSLLQILFFIRKNRIAIIHTHSVFPHIYGLLIKICSPKMLFVAHVHADIYRELISNVASPLKRKIYYFASFLGLKVCDAIVAISGAVRTDLIKKGISPQKIRVVYNGIDVEKIEKDAREHHDNGEIIGKIKNKRVVGTIGRITPIKNHRLLVLAAQEVIARYPDVMFIIVGEGKERKGLEKMVSDLGLRDHFIFTGWMDTPYSVLSSMDIFVLTSTWEGLGLVVLEAMALRKPVIATNVGGVPEIVEDGETGILIPSENIRALADTLLRLLNDSALRQRMGEKGKAVAARNFSISNMVTGIEQVYSSLAGVS